MITFIPRKVGEQYTRFIVSGSISSFIVSLLLFYIAPFPGIDRSNAIITSILTAAGYFVLYYTMGVWLRTQIIYGSTDDYLRAVMPEQPARVVSNPLQGLLSTNK